MNYKILAKVMNDYFNNKTFHITSDKVLQKSKIVNKKYYYPCEIQQEITIDNHTFIFHHYGCKYKDIILYFPGGSFIDPPTFLHYKYSKRLSKKIKKHVIMVQYPMYPEVNPDEIATLMVKIIEKKNYKKFYLMGDSAGANLAGFVLSSLHKNNLNYVSKAIFISPFTDKKLDYSEILLIKDYDFVLNVNNLKALVDNVYEDNTLSYGYNNLFPDDKNFKYNTDALFISGEKEILTPGIKKYCRENKKLNIKHLIYKNMCHCFVLINCKESKNAIKKIEIFLN